MSDPTMSPDLDRPIVIVGAARSGTTVFGELIARHRDVAYWVEPKYIWQYGRPTARDDIRLATEATEKVQRYIRGRFASFVEARGKPRFAEKTPSNCFRIPFIDAVLPDARFLHVVRDGRDVVFSAQRKWTEPPAADAILRRLTSFEIPLRDAGLYLAKALANSWRNPWRKRGWDVWGPRYPGIEEDRENRTLLEVCALQWAHSVRTLGRDLAAVPPERVVTVRYEDLAERPAKVLEDTYAGLGLDPSPDAIAFAEAHARPGRTGRWRSRSESELDRILPVIGAELQALGYE